MEKQLLEGESIESLRNQIDVIDINMHRFLVQRFQIAQKLGELKKNEGRDIEDLERELEITKKWEKFAEEESIPFSVFEKIISEIIASSKLMQE